MRIPANAVIPPEKLTHYLLQQRPWDEKARFLAQAGFTLQNAVELKNAIRQMAANVDAIEDGMNDYGIFYRVEGELEGNKDSLQVVQIWLQWKLDETFHFVTLKPRKTTP